MRVEWSIAARISARRYLAGQPGMRAVATAVSSLAVNPNPPEAFIRGSYRRLKAGACRVMYVLDDDVVTIEQVDRVI